MSNLSIVETSRRKQLLASIPIIFILLLGLLYFIPPTKVIAASPSVVLSASSICYTAVGPFSAVCTSGTTMTPTIATTAGDLEVLILASAIQGYCNTFQTSVSSSLGNTFTATNINAFVGLGQIMGGVGQGHDYMSILYSNSAFTGSDIVTVTLNQNPTNCATYLLDFTATNMALGFIPVGVTLAGSGVLPQSGTNPNFFAPPLTINTQNPSVNPTAPFITILVPTNAVTDTSNCGAPIVSTLSPPMTTAIGGGCNTGTVFEQVFWASNMLSASNIIETITYTGCPQGACNNPQQSYLWGEVFFGSQGLVSPVCKGFPQQWGQTFGSPYPITTTTQAITSNQTYMYTFQTATSATMLNISTRIASVTATSIPTKLTLAVYEVINTNPISTANPLNKLFNFTWKLTTNNNPQTFWVVPSSIIQPSATVVVALATSHNGVTGYKAGGSGLILTTDSSDPLVTGQPPQLIKIQTQVSSNLFYFGAVIGMNCVIAGTGSNSFQTITVTTGAPPFTVTTYLYSLQGTAGATGIIQDLTAYLPLWLPPILLGGWFGMIGLFIGTIIGVGMGTAFGIIPLWFAFLLALGILYMMSKLR